jgi:hypothetical protein
VAVELAGGLTLLQRRMHALARLQRLLLGVAQRHHEAHLLEVGHLAADARVLGEDARIEAPEAGEVFVPARARQDDGHEHGGDRRKDPQPAPLRAERVEAAGQRATTRERSATGRNVAGMSAGSM